MYSETYPEVQSYSPGRGLWLTGSMFNAMGAALSETVKGAAVMTWAKRPMKQIEESMLI